MFLYPDTDPSSVAQKLKEHVQAKAGEIRKYAIPIQWTQLSICFCNVRDQTPTPQSMLWFNEGELLIDEEQFPLREHLLFVHYSPSRLLTIYGDLSFEAYKSLRDLGYITLGDLNPEHLRYNEIAAEKEFLMAARQFENYLLNVSKTVHPDAAFESRISFDKRLEAISTAFNQVLGFSHNRTVRGANPEDLYHTILTDILQTPNKDVIFYYGLLLAACHHRFLNEFILNEKARVVVLCNLYYTTEIKRATLIRQMFPNTFTIKDDPTSQYYQLPHICPPPPESPLGLLYKDHQARRPTEPYPGFSFTASVDACAELISSPLLNRGIVTFSHYEIPLFLQSYIETHIRQQIGVLQRGFNLHFAERYWIPIQAERNFNGTHCSVAKNIYSWVRSEDTREELTHAVKPYDELKAESLLAQAILPLVGSLDTVISIQSFEAVWPTHRSFSEEVTAEIEQLRTEEVPQSREELIIHAKKFYPPCMQRMIEECVGDNHLKYRKRLKLSGQLRTFGYSRNQAETLWEAIFSRTTVHAVSRGDFFSTKHGSVVKSDFNNNKFTRIGVSCTQWINEGLCVFGPVTDIENCQMQCQSSFQSPDVHPLNWPIRSPAHYFRMKRKHQKA